MGIFDFFKRNERSDNKTVVLPDELRHLLSHEDFNSILTFAITHLKDSGHSNISFADGLLVYETAEDSGAQIQTNFVNLVKSVLCEEKKDWKTKTAEYFENLNKDKNLENEVLLSFEKAREYLTVRLHPASNYKDEPYKSHVETLVYKTDIPESYSLLALDLPSRFHILTIKEIDVWNIDRVKLFEIAHNNLLEKIENIKAQKHNWDGADFYTLFDRDYSASYCIDFANSCSNLIGEKGSLVSFPTRGSVFIHPITNKEQFNIAYKHIAEKTNTFFDDDPGPISRNIYWFNENKFILFDHTWKNEGIVYNIPQQLLDQL